METTALSRGASPRSGVVPPESSRFRKGRSGNPSGKPKGFYSISKACIDLLSWHLEDLELFLRVGDLLPGLEDQSKLPALLAKRIKPAHLVARALFLTAMTPGALGQARAAVEIADRTEGKARLYYDIDAQFSSVSDLVQRISADLGDLT